MKLGVKMRTSRTNRSEVSIVWETLSRKSFQINIFVLFGFLAIVKLTFSGLLRFAPSFLASLIVVRIRIFFLWTNWTIYVCRHFEKREQNNRGKCNCEAGLGVRWVRGGRWGTNLDSWPLLNNIYNIKEMKCSYKDI